MMKARKLQAIILALTFCLSLIIPVMAAETVVTTEENLRNALTNGGDVVIGSDISIQSTLTVSASSTLDLNGYKLTVTTRDKSGIVIDAGQTLTITDSKYSKNGSNNGKLSVNGYRAGIQTSGATLIINSGIVEATGKWATGIGGIDQSGYYDGGTVTINGGTVTATGGCPGTHGGAGIGGMGPTVGGGGNGGTITINGGTVTATGGTFGSGIGGGGCVAWSEVGGSSGTITINGGTVRAKGNQSNHHYAADIGQGGGKSSDNGTVRINGGTVYLLDSGISTKTVSLRNCTITGEGAGEYKGSYDASGTLVVVNGASAWASDDLAGAIAKGLVPAELQSDYTQTTTRAQFCAFAVALYENLTRQEITERKMFSDTSDVNVEKMGALGVIYGTGDDQSNPNGILTREQAATMLARLAETVGEPLPEEYTAFSDRNQISSWAMTAVGQVQVVGIMSGVGNNMFDPSGLYSREQSIVTILRLYNLVQ